MSEEEYEHGGGYKTDAELEAERPARDRLRDGCLERCMPGCVIDLFAIVLLVGVPAHFWIG